MKRKSLKVRELSVPISVAVGVMVAMLLGVLLTALVSYLVVSGQVADDVLGAVIPVLQFVSMFIGGLIASLVSANKAGMIPIVLSAVFILLLVAGHILLIEEGMQISIGTIIAAVASAAINLLLVMRHGKGKKVKLRSR